MRNLRKIRYILQNKMYLKRETIGGLRVSKQILNSFDNDDTRKKQISRERNWLKFDFHFQRNERKRK